MNDRGMPAVAIGDQGGQDTAGQDGAAIEATVRGYFEGWFAGDEERMRRSLHPGLAKRTLTTQEGGRQTLDESSATDMIDATARGIGRTRGQGDRGIEIQIVDAYDGIASVVVRSTVYREYLHLAATSDGWKIVNALWTWA